MYTHQPHQNLCLYVAVMTSECGITLLRLKDMCAQAHCCLVGTCFRSLSICMVCAPVGNKYLAVKKSPTSSYMCRIRRRYQGETTSIKSIRKSNVVDKLIANNGRQHCRSESTKRRHNRIDKATIAMTLAREVYLSWLPS